MATLSENTGTPENELQSNASLKNEPYAIAKYPFNSAHFDELSCQPNDIIILKKQVKVFKFFVAVCSNIVLFFKFPFIPIKFNYCLIKKIIIGW